MEFENVSDHVGYVQDSVVAKGLTVEGYVDLIKQMVNDENNYKTKKDFITLAATVGVAVTEIWNIHYRNESELLAPDTFDFCQVVRMFASESVHITSSLDVAELDTAAQENLIKQFKRILSGVETLLVE